MRTIVDAGNDIMKLKSPGQGHARFDFHAYARGLQPYNTARQERGPDAGAPGLIWQGEGVHKAILTSPYMEDALSQLAMCCRFFGTKRGRQIWGKQAGLSMCEAAVRQS